MRITAVRRSLATLRALVVALAAPACGSLLAVSADGEPTIEERADSGDGDAASSVSSADGSSVIVTDPTDAGGEDATSVLSPSQVYRAAVMQDAPIAYWRFADPIGTNSYASETNKHAAAAGSGPKAPQSGAEGIFGAASHALSFNGTNGQHASVSDLPFLAGTFTFEAWVHRVTALDDDYRHLFQHSNGSTSQGIYLRASEGIVFERIASGTKNQERMPGGASTQSWHHVVATRDAELHLWVDGVEQQTTDTYAAGAAPNGSFFLAAKDADSVSLPAGTRIAEVAVYDKALPGPRIAAHYALGKK